MVGLLFLDAHLLYAYPSFSAQKLALARYNKLVSSTGELMISGSDDHTLFLWSIFPSRAATAEGSAAAAERGGKLKPLSRLTGHQRQVAHVVFSPDGRWAASAAWDNSVRVWDGKTGKFVATLRGHISAVYRLAWSADSRLLVSASKDNTLKVGCLSASCFILSSHGITFVQIWDLKTYKLKTDLPGHSDEVYCVDFVADKIVSGGRDRTVKMCVPLYVPGSSSLSAPMQLEELNEIMAGCLEISFRLFHKSRCIDNPGTRRIDRVSFAQLPVSLAQRSARNVESFVG